MIPINISSQSPVSKENLSDRAQLPGLCGKLQSAGGLESIYLEIKMIKIRHYSQQPYC